MPPRPRLPAGTELVVALVVCATRRSDQARLWLQAGDRIVVDGDFQGLIHGRVLSGTKTAIGLVQADLARLTYADGRPVIAGGATPKPASTTSGPAVTPPVPAEERQGYLQGRRLLNFWDMPR